MFDEAPRRAIALLPALLLVACLYGTGQPSDAAAAELRESAKGRSKLLVRIHGLPPGTRAKIVVRGGGRKWTLKRTTGLKKLRPGKYTIRPYRTKLKRTLAGVPAGSPVLPSTKKYTARLRARTTTIAGVRYGTVVDARLRRVDEHVVSSEGPPENPTKVVLRGGADVGALLNARPSPLLPAGLFHRVVSVSPADGGVAAELEPAHIKDVFPQLLLASEVRLAPQGLSHARLSGADLDPLVASLSLGSFSCSGPVADSRLDAAFSLRPKLEAYLQVPNQWGIPTGEAPHGRLVLKLTGTAALDVLIRKNVGCAVDAALPPLYGFVPIGPAVLPVFAKTGLAGSLSVSEDLEGKATAFVNLSAGAGFVFGRQFNDLSKADGTAEFNGSGAGTVSMGPYVGIGAGVAGAGDLHLNSGTSFEFTRSLGHPPCSVDLAIKSQIGVTLGPSTLDQELPGLARRLLECVSPAELSVTKTGPPGAFPNQAFDYAITVTNKSGAPAKGVEILDTLPSEGSFVSGPPGSTPSSPPAGATYVIPVGDVPAGESRTVKVRWRAPAGQGSLTNTAVARAANAPETSPATASVEFGTAVRCNPCGATAAGTGLRNRDHGSIDITGVPAGATVSRAVLIWAILFNPPTPSNAITFQGTRVTADVTSNVSGTLCWEDTSTVGYAADVTDHVTGNGTYHVTDPPRGATRVDADPVATRPYTDGASLIVFYNGGGSENQVLSDFAYETNTEGDTTIKRSFSGIRSVGGPASLILAGPDGQNRSESFHLDGAGSRTLASTFNGSDHQDGPSFPIGNLWDTDVFDVRALLPAGQETLNLSHVFSDDCVGIGAAVLQVAQR